MKLFASIFVALLVSISSSFALAVENTSAASDTKMVQAQQVVNLNTADKESLLALKGIGEKKAEAIIAWRETNGSFTAVDQLLEVKGIGSAILEANREKLRI